MESVITRPPVEVLFGLWGRLEAAMASEATEMVVIGNTHMDIREIEVTELNWGHLEAAVAYEVIKMNVQGNKQIKTRVIEVTELRSEVKFNTWSHWHCCPLLYRAIALWLCHTVWIVKWFPLTTSPLQNLF